MGVASRRAFGALVVGREMLIGVLGDVIGQRAQAVANDGDGQGRGRLAEPHLVGEKGGGDTAGRLASEYPEKGPELVEAEGPSSYLEGYV